MFYLDCLLSSLRHWMVSFDNLTSREGRPQIAGLVLTCVALCVRAYVRENQRLKYRKGEWAREIRGDSLNICATLACSKPLRLIH